MVERLPGFPYEFGEIDIEAAEYDGRQKALKGISRIGILLGKVIDDAHESHPIV
jgi:hypothetical protein